MSDMLCDPKPVSGAASGTPEALLNRAAEVFGTSILACFTRGMRIETDQGPVPIEAIEEGYLIHTLDNGLQPVRRVLSKTVQGVGALAPVVFRAGVLGNVRDLVVSPHHRVLLSGWQAELLVDRPEALAMARDLVNGSTIHHRPMAQVEYFHLLFDRHEVVFVEGAATESYHPLLPDSDIRSPATQAELMALFPHLELQAQVFGPAVRPTLTPEEAALFNL